ncbi:hypothetical protein M885DRAFT_531354, partial [Pelagophyceae sp. CCMP2097]
MMGVKTVTPSRRCISSSTRPAAGGGLSSPIATRRRCVALAFPPGPDGSWGSTQEARILV